VARAGPDAAVAAGAVLAVMRPFGERASDAHRRKMGNDRCGRRCGSGLPRGRPAGVGISWVIAADLDGDGKLDLAVSNNDVNGADTANDTLSMHVDLCFP
jgi:hypothetical protein